jgi:hypothetical protein
VLNLPAAVRPIHRVPGSGAEAGLQRCRGNKRCKRLKIQNYERISKTIETKLRHTLLLHVSKLCFFRSSLIENSFVILDLQLFASFVSSTNL